MRALSRLIVALTALAAVVPAWADPARESNAAAQAAADALRTAAGTDAAFLAAGVLRPEFRGGDLARLVQFPGDEVAVVNLTGRQLRAALERSVSLIPSPNPAFLQVSGIEATFRAASPPNQRIQTLTFNGSPVDEDRTYTVAMPGNLARGGLGYFTVWDKDAIDRTLPGLTLESVLRGKTAPSEMAARVRAVD